MASVVAARYASALIHVVRAQGLDAAATERQLQDFAATMEASSPLREVMLNPSIPLPQKLAVLDSIAERLGMPRQVRNFLAILTEHQRLAELRAMAEEFGLLADEGSGVTEVDITTARPIGDEERRELEGKAGELAGGPVKASYHEDASVLGGAILRIGSTVYDGSLRAQFAGMKRQLSEARAGQV